MRGEDHGECRPVQPGSYMGLTQVGLRGVFEFHVRRLMQLLPSPVRGRRHTITCSGDIMGWDLPSKDPISCHSIFCPISSVVLQQTVGNDEICSVSSRAQRIGRGNKLVIGLQHPSQGLEVATTRELIRTLWGTPVLTRTLVELCTEEPKNGWLRMNAAIKWQLVATKRVLVAIENIFLSLPAPYSLIVVNMLCHPPRSTGPHSQLQ